MPSVGARNVSIAVDEDTDMIESAADTSNVETDESSSSHVTSLVPRNIEKIHQLCQLKHLRH